MLIGKGRLWTRLWVHRTAFGTRSSDRVVRVSVYREWSCLPREGGQPNSGRGRLAVKQNAWAEAQAVVWERIEIERRADRLHRDGCMRSKAAMRNPFVPDKETDVAPQIHVAI